MAFLYLIAFSNSNTFSQKSELQNYKQAEMLKAFPNSCMMQRLLMSPSRVRITLSYAPLVAMTHFLHIYIF